MKKNILYSEQRLIYQNLEHQNNPETVETGQNKPVESQQSLQQKEKITEGLNKTKNGIEQTQEILNKNPELKNLEPKFQEKGMEYKFEQNPNATNEVIITYFEKVSPEIGVPKSITYDISTKRLNKNDKYDGKTMRIDEFTI